MGRPFDSSPADRVVQGTVLNPRGLNDPVLRGVIGHTTGDIRLTPTANTIVGSAAYNFGRLDDRAIGTYRLEWQSAASPSAEPLGAISRMEFTIYENAPGVYLAKINRTAAVENPGTESTAFASHSHNIDDSGETVSATAIADDTLSLLVMDSAAITAYAGVATAEVAAAVGDLMLVDASATGTRVYSLTRLS